jgi:hypothetical protein
METGGTPPTVPPGRHSKEVEEAGERWRRDVTNTDDKYPEERMMGEGCPNGD